MSWISKLLLMAVRRWPVVRAIALVGVLFAAISSQYRVHQLDIVVEADIPVGSVAQVFYSFDGLSYYPENSRVMQRPHRDARGILQATLRTVQPIKAFRFDPVNAPGTVLWRSLRLSGNAADRRYGPSELSALGQAVEQLEFRTPATEDGLVMLATGIDPKMVIAVPETLTRISLGQRAQAWGIALAWALALTLVIEMFVRLLSRQHPLNVRARAFFGRWAAAWSDDGVLTFPASAMVIYAVIAMFAVVWVGLKLHQSSIGLWDEKYPQEYVQRDIRLGSPKPIRSDEWGVFTPWILSQVSTGMPVHNPNVGPLGAPMLADMPVASALMLAQPKHWGFFFLDVDRGFSWFWAYKTFGFVAAFFTLLLLVTRGDTLVSLAGAVALYGSSFMQWWLSTVPSELITGFSVSVVGATYLLQARRTGGMVFGALAVAWAIPNLLMNLYPPYLLPLAYLAVFLMAGLHVNAAAWGRFNHRVGLRSGLMLLSVLLTAWLVAMWYAITAEAIEVMLNTGYPGRRFSLGGDGALDTLFYGLFESWKVNDDQTPFHPMSPPEASSFWHFFPLALLVLSPLHWFKTEHRLPLLLLVYCLVVTAWIAVPLPHGVREVMAHAGWYLSPYSRAQVGLAVASMLLVCLLVAGKRHERFSTAKIPSALIAAGVLGLALLYGMHLNSRDPAFFEWWRIVLGAVVLALVVWAVHGGYRKVFAALMVAIALPPLYVNPLESGIEALREKDILVQARKLGGAPSDRWAVFGDTLVAQGFRAVGLRVVNGTQYAPDPAFYQQLDPSGAFRPAWNRYAHVEFKQARDAEPMSMKAIFLDHIVVTLDVCGSELRRMGITHVAFTGEEPSDAARNCLTPLLENHDSKVNLYRLK